MKTVDQIEFTMGILKENRVTEQVKLENKVSPLGDVSIIAGVYRRVLPTGQGPLERLSSIEINGVKDIQGDQVAVAFEAIRRAMSEGVKRGSIMGSRLIINT